MGFLCFPNVSKINFAYEVSFPTSIIPFCFIYRIN